MKAEKHEVQKIDLHGIDPERMNAALASYADTLAEIEKGDAASAALVARIDAVNAEISRWESVAFERPDYANMTLPEVSVASERVNAAHHKVAGLNSLRTELSRQLVELNNGRDYYGFSLKSGSKTKIFRTLYEGFKSNFPVDKLNQLIAAGVACGVPETMIMQELGARYYASCLEPFVQQYGLPQP